MPSCFAGRLHENAQHKGAIAVEKLLRLTVRLGGQGEVEDGQVNRLFDADVHEERLHTRQIADDRVQRGEQLLLMLLGCVGGVLAAAGRRA
jgi:hypothetical protein